MEWSQVGKDDSGNNSSLREVLVPQPDSRNECTISRVLLLGRHRLSRVTEINDLSLQHPQELLPGRPDSEASIHTSEDEQNQSATVFTLSSLPFLFSDPVFLERNF